MWTSVHDIGIDNEGRVLSREEYLNAERAYIALIYVAFVLSGDEFFYVRKIEGNAGDIEAAVDFAKRNALDLVNYFSIFEFDHDIPVSMLSNILRLILREHIWGQVCSQSGMVFDFGYDYYLYITGFSRHGLIDIARSLGLEAVIVDKSPYAQ